MAASDGLWIGSADDHCRAGPTEGTAIGNLIIQFIAAGVFKDLADARAAVARSFDVKRV